MAIDLRRLAATGMVLGLTLAGGTMAAEAACTRLAFSVNDYGKDGPTKDAKALLDKYIAQWTAERGIKSYTTGKKTVSCDLFLDFIVFDEHTCKAEATVCWPGNKPAGGLDASAPAPAAPKAAAAKPASAIQTGTVEKPKAQ